MKIVLLVIMLLLIGCNDMEPTRQSPTPTPAPIYLTLRERALTVDPHEIGLPPVEGGQQTWAVLMDMGWPDATVTLVAVGDGATSLYFSNGGGIIGAGESPAVAEVSQQYVAEAASYLTEMTLTEAYPLPEAGRVRFYVMTYDGAYTADVAEEALRQGQHPLTPLYMMAQAVITQVRLEQERRQ